MNDQQKAYDVLKKKSGIRTQEVTEMAGFTKPRQAEGALYRLKMKGLATYVGNGLRARWSLVPDAKRPIDMSGKAWRNMSGLELSPARIKGRLITEAEAEALMLEASREAEARRPKDLSLASLLGV
jgi:hypothetical protein